MAGAGAGLGLSWAGLAGLCAFWGLGWGWGYPEAERVGLGRAGLLWLGLGLGSEPFLNLGWAGWLGVGFLSLGWGYPEAEIGLFEDGKVVFKPKQKRASGCQQQQAISIYFFLEGLGFGV